MAGHDDYIFELVRRFGLLRLGGGEAASHSDGDQTTEAAAGFSRCIEGRLASREAAKGPPAPANEAVNELGTRGQTPRYVVGSVTYRQRV